MMPNENPMLERVRFDAAWDNNLKQAKLCDDAGVDGR